MVYFYVMSLAITMYIITMCAKHQVVATCVWLILHESSLLQVQFWSYWARAGGNGAAGTAMAVPVFEEEKWRRLDSNLRVCYI